MSTTEQQWLTLILVTWALASIAVLAAMLGTIVSYRSRTSPNPFFRPGAVFDAAWMLVPVTIVILMVVLVFRIQDAASTGEMDSAALPQAAVDTATASHAAEQHRERSQR